MKIALEQGEHMSQVTEEARIAAAEVLSLYWSDRGFPVDPVYIAKQMGVKVLKTDLPENVSGALIKEPGKDPVILLHEPDSDNRKRFTCAHELGHFYQRAEEDEYNTVDFRDAVLSSSASNPAEIFANQFAANLLMPGDEVKERSKMSKMALLGYFGVSGDAMKFRLRTLRIDHAEFPE